MALVQFLVASPARSPIARGLLNERRVAFLITGETEVQVGIVLAELGEDFAIQKVMNRLVIAFANLHQMLWQVVALGIAMLQVSREISAFASQTVRVFIE